MIIKTLSWKFKGWRRLIRYITKQRGEPGSLDLEICHNFPPSRETEDIAGHFRENDLYRKKRKNGVVLYHEILSFSGHDNPTPAILRDITHYYLDLRAPNALAFAGVHKDKEHTHIHVMISGNDFKGAKITALTRERFIGVRTELEKYQLEQYSKELSHSIAYTDLQRKREQKRRHKEKIRSAIDGAVQTSKTLEEFWTALERDGHELYWYRGKPNGILREGVKYRLRSLGVDLSGLLPPEPHKTIDQAKAKTPKKDKATERIERFRARRRESREKGREEGRYR